MFHVQAIVEAGELQWTNYVIYANGRDAIRSSFKTPNSWRLRIILKSKLAFSGTQSCMLRSVRKQVCFLLWSISISDISLFKIKTKPGCQ